MLKRESDAAKTKAAKAKTASKRSLSAYKSERTTRAKQAWSTFAKKEKAFSVAKRKADALQSSSEKANKKVKTSRTAVATAKKAAI